MIDKVFIPDNGMVSLPIPEEMVGKKVKVLAYMLDEETDVVENLISEMRSKELAADIPEWHKGLVLAEKKRVEENPHLLTSWSQVKRELKQK